MAAKEKIYFAHPISEYGSKNEARVVEALEKRGYDVINPNSAVHQAKVKELQAQFNTEANPKAAGEHVMKYFVDVCDSCDAVAAMPFPNGMFGAGVVKEVNSFVKRTKDVFGISVQGENILIDKMRGVPESRRLNVDDTRAMLAKLKTPGYGTK
jgi:hypothetical protein